MKRAGVQRIGWPMLAIWLWGVVPLAQGEVFVLTSGGQIAGRLLNPDQSPRQTYVIETSTHGRITLHKAQVREVRFPRPEEQEYERICPRYPDTVDGQWELAQWCAQRGLRAQRSRHLQRIIELDPDHAAARRALGYLELDGHWATTAEVMTARGYRMYQGRWRTAQEIALLESRRQLKEAEGGWMAKLRRWQGWLHSDRHAAARENILAIKDPRAIKALTALLQGDRFVDNRLLYVETLAQIATPAAVQVLAARALHDPAEQVRLACLDHLRKQLHPNLIRYFVKELDSRNNSTVNRAAVALGRLGDRSAVGPLIDALVSTHAETIQQGSPGTMTTTFAKGPGSSAMGGLSVGGGTTTFTQLMRNQAVLDALVAITGENFGFDQQAWKYWHAMWKRQAALDAQQGSRRREGSPPR